MKYKVHGCGKCLVGFAIRVQTPFGFHNGVVTDFLETSGKFVVHMDGGGYCYTKSVYLI